MNGKWSEYKYREAATVEARYNNLVIYHYYDNEFEEERYAVVLEDTIMINSRQYPVAEICIIENVYSSMKLHKSAGQLSGQAL